ncbi:MAG: acetyl-CoA carboxylase biotin carboxyl carrier protein [Candidatus Binataceae bacterium]
MEVREIKALVALMREYGLIELELEDKKIGKVRLVRALADDEGAKRRVSELPQPSDGAARSPAVKGPVRRVEAATAKAALASPQALELAPNQRMVQSPMVGTFYRAASPDAAPFVEEGDSVRKGQPLCIIEAMKMMNEIEAEMAGRVIRILCDNGQPVQYGQPLAVLEIS